MLSSLNCRERNPSCRCYWLLLTCIALAPSSLLETGTGIRGVGTGALGAAAAPHLTAAASHSGPININKQVLAPPARNGRGVMSNLRRLDRPLHVYFWQRLLGSGARVADGDLADWYFIPVRQRSFSDSWFLREALSYIRTHHPWWNRTEGHRHMVLHTGDWGLGEVAKDVRQMSLNVTWLTHWGLSTDRPNIQRWTRAFRPERDVVIPVYISPGHFVHFGINRSPLHPVTAASRRTAARPRNESLLFFAGRICHDAKRPNPDTFPACGDDTAEWYGGGVREKFFVSHWNRSGFHVVRSEPRYSHYMSRSVFCLAPPGAGHGQRQIQALFMGCVPVTVADGVYEPFEPALSWEEWGLRIAEQDIPRAHELLGGLTREQLAEKQSRMHCAAQHMLYSTITGAVLGEDGRYDAFETTLEVLRVRAAHPDAPQQDFRRLDPDFAAFMDCRPPPGFNHAARDLRFRERSCYQVLRGGGYMGVPGGAMCAKGFKTRLAACPRLWG
ncbi:acetylglucosaminyltransferase [Volvox carteri f. nagariensis]|uniref:Acetylglucosaminyltransferase n=1 Tax=Volvox carteri f. nagariensis TaxID=3068 RepID=D8TSL8_VOLCA|nr:acetylglucosaminyltransferase [Volvox carteri f. nagariensis]EFJ49509.1 acetylglucosaminyltransferase [Volvox carteri f. nagariensis]|eukprot:XP_002949490.1 acetylglucosaminyltransferase [Volvox carteri f. nagariensis]